MKTMETGPTAVKTLERVFPGLLESVQRAAIDTSGNYAPYDEVRVELLKVPHDLSKMPAPDNYLLSICVPAGGWEIIKFDYIGARSRKIRGCIVRWEITYIKTLIIAGGGIPVHHFPAHCGTATFNLHWGGNAFDKDIPTKILQHAEISDHSTLRSRALITHDLIGAYVESILRHFKLDIPSITIFRTHLASLKLLEYTKNIKYLNLNSVTGITDLQGLENNKTMRRLCIRQCKDLTSLKGLPPAFENISIVDCPTIGPKQFEEVRIGDIKCKSIDVDGAPIDSSVYTSEYVDVVEKGCEEAGLNLNI